MTSSSHVLVFGSNSIQTLVPSTLISQLESLLDSHRLEDAFNLADAKRKKLEESIELNEDEAEELRYVYQRLGFQYFTETLFEDAGNNLFNGELDPRILISYFPELRGGLFTSDDEVDMFAGVAERMPQEQSVDDIIVSNLVRNYSPHLSPDTLSAPPTAELRRILYQRAIDMLEKFLKKERRRRMALDLDREEEDAEKVGKGKGKGKEVRRGVRAIIDTVLTKLYSHSEKTSELYDLLSSPNSVVLSEVESVFEETGQYNALCMLYQKEGEEGDEKLLEVWSRLVEGEWTDLDIPDPLLQMISLLTSKRDKKLTQKWGIWLTKRDPEAGIRLLTTLRETSTGTSGKRRDRDRTTAEEDLALLSQIEEASPSAGKQYLEYLILQKRTNSRELHSRLGLSCAQQVLSALRDDEGVSKLWRAKTSSYTSSALKSHKPPISSSPSSPPSFLSYFASTTPDSPSKRSRLRLILFLAGSPFYDPLSIKDEIVREEREKLLTFEMAILEGKIGNHKSALRILARELNDAVSAETYCTLAGDIVLAKLAVSIAEGSGLVEWGRGLFPAAAATGISKSISSQSTDKHGATTPGLSVNAPKAKQKIVDDGLRKDLLKMLLEVYMNDESSQSSEHATRLLDAQAMNLDVLDVITLVPPTWPLPSLSSFLTRSFRRTTHAMREGLIVKNISAGQNLEVKEKTWEILSAEGAVIEEEDDDEDGEYDEKKALVNKVVDLVVEGNGGNGDEKRSRTETESFEGTEDTGDNGLV